MKLLGETFWTTCTRKTFDIAFNHSHRNTVNVAHRKKIDICEQYENKFSMTVQKPIFLEGTNYFN